MAAAAEIPHGIVLARRAGPAAGRRAGRQDTVAGDQQHRRQRGLIIAIIFHQLVEDGGDPRQPLLIRAPSTKL